MPLNRKFVPATAAALCAVAAALPALAALNISTNTTNNVSCSKGVCTATANNAVLNVTDLTNLLSAGDLKVETGGYTQDIRVDASFSWSSAALLTFDAARSVAVNDTMAVEGSGGLAVITNDGGTNGRLSFAPNGQVTFANLSSALTINQQSYKLEGKISTLAADIASNPGGSFALANNYDASGDGTYSSPPISTRFTGTFEGLDNTISNLSINVSNVANIGLFADVAGTLADLQLVNANVQGNSSQTAGPTGVLAGLNEGTIVGAATNGSVSGTAGNYAYVGGLVGMSAGSIAYSHSAANVTAGSSGVPGGLVGNAYSGTIYASSATGSVSGGQGSEAGGLVGTNGGQIEQSFATGAVTSDAESKSGGFVGYDSGPIGDCYATGAVAQEGSLGYASGFAAFFEPAGTNILTRSYSTGSVSGGNETGGFIGFDNSSGTNLAFNYWDTTTSGMSQGAGFPQNDPGIKGLTSKQLQSRLPHDFHRSTWAEAGGVNQGFPYLRANPPAN